MAKKKAAKRPETRRPVRAVVQPRPHGQQVDTEALISRLKKLSRNIKDLFGECEYTNGFRHAMQHAMFQIRRDVRAAKRNSDG